MTISRHKRALVFLAGGEPQNFRYDFFEKKKRSFIKQKNNNNNTGAIFISHVFGAFRRV